MKKILKTVLATGLVASSSFALAEGKFVFRQPLQGVDGQEYYGMSQSQINDAIAEQERLAQIEADKAMCLNETYTETLKWEVDQKIYDKRTLDENSIWGGITINDNIPLVRVGELLSQGGPFSSYPPEDRFPNSPGIRSPMMYIDVPESGLNGDPENYLDPNTRYRANIYPEGGIRATANVELQDGTTVSARLYEVNIEKLIAKIDATENYQWCIDQGYPTAK